MLLRPRVADFQVIGFFIGKIIIGAGLLMLVPLITCLFFQEWSAAIDFTIGATLCFIVGFILTIAIQPARDLTWTQGLVVVSTSWVAATFLGAVPHYLSGHFLSYLDVIFDLVSGYTLSFHGIPSGINSCLILFQYRFSRDCFQHSID